MILSINSGLVIPSCLVIMECDYDGGAIKYTNISIFLFTNGFKSIPIKEFHGTTTDDVSQDIINTSIIILLNGKNEPDKHAELNNGIMRLKGYVFKEKYSINSAINNAGKATHLAITLLKSNNCEFEKFSMQEPEEMDVLPVYVKRLNILKKIDSEAYYYWIKVLNALNNN